MHPSDRRRTFLLSLLMGVIVALAVGLGALAMLRGAQDEGLPLLRQTAEAGGEAIGRAVAGQIERAVNYGIPLERLRGLDNYLNNIVQSLSQVTAIAVLDAGGKPVYSTAEIIHGPRFPIQQAGQEIGAVVIGIAPTVVEKGVTRLELALIAAALFAGVNAGIVTYLVLRHHIDAAERHLRDTFEAMRAGSFPHQPLPGGRGIVVATFRALDRCFDPLRKAERRLEDAVATVRGIDFDGSLHDRMQALLSPVAPNAAAMQPAHRTATANETVSSSVDGLALWPAALIVTAYAAATPLVGNYAVDREWSLVPASWWPGLPLLADLLAISIAAWLAGTLNRSLRDFLGMAGLLVAALCTAAVAVNHGYVTFLALRAAAGLGLGLALAAAFAGAPALGQLRSTWRLLIYAGAIAGPVLGGLIAEATGRRAAFVILGLTLLASVLTLPGLRHLPTSRTAPRHMPSPILLILGLIGALLGAAATWIPVYPGYDSYLIGGLALAGIGALIILALVVCPPPVVPSFGDAWAAALGYAVGVAAMMLIAPRDGQSFLALMAGGAILLAVSLLVLRHRHVPPAIDGEGVS